MEPDLGPLSREEKLLGALVLLIALVPFALMIV